MSVSRKSRGGRAYTWEELAALTLARQFPRVRRRGEAAVVDVVRRTGPVQSQAARAPFLSLAARLPGVGHAAVTAAHESLALVRSTSLRGTVHTSTRELHADLAAVATRSLTPGLRRWLLLDEAAVAEFRWQLERLTASGWTVHDALLEGIVGWMRSQGRHESVTMLERDGARYMVRGHPAMLRRPPAGAGWESQADVLYRAASYALGEVAGDPEVALVSLVRHHVAASGPVSRRDLAWWSGAGLRQVDAAVAALGDELVVRPGPNGLDYFDLASGTSQRPADVGVRLLPEYDALLLAYDPAARDRFADAEAVAYSWNKRNGVHAPTVLADGRVRGVWQLARKGNAATLTVRMLPGERLLNLADLAGPAIAVGAALGVDVTDVQVGAVDCR